MIYAAVAGFVGVLGPLVVLCVLFQKHRVPSPDPEHIARFYGTPTVLRNNARDNFYEALALRHMPSRRQDGQRAQVERDWTGQCSLVVPSPSPRSSSRDPLPVPQSLLRSCVIKRLGKGVRHALSLDSASSRVPCPASLGSLELQSQ